MNDIKKIVLFKDETSKDGGSWLIIRDSGYESVSLNEGKRICAEYAAMNGITTKEMVDEQLLNKVVFYSPDFNSALRDYVFNNNNNDYKNVYAENNDIVSGTDNISNDGEYMLAEDAKKVVDVGEKKPRQFVMVGDPYVPVESNDDSDSSKSSKVSDSKILSSEENNVNSNPVEGAEEVVEVGEKKPNQFVLLGNPYVPVEGNDDLDSSDYFAVIDNDDTNEAGDKEVVEEEPTREDDDKEVVEEEPTREDDDIEVVEEEPTREEDDNEVVEEEPTREDDDIEVVEEEPTSEDDDDEEEIEEEPTREEEDDDEEEVEEEPTSEDDDEEEIEEEPTSEEEHEEEVSEEETMDEEDIGIIDKIKKFGNSVLEKLKKFTIFGTIVGMVVAGIVSIFGVKYSLNRDKDDIYVTHSSNTEEIPDDEYLYSSPLANFVDGVINNNESVTDEENENEEILMGDDTDLEIDDNVSTNTDNDSNLPNQYIPYSFESESIDNDVEDFTTDDSNYENVYDNYEDLNDYLTYYDTDESKLVETATDTDTNESGLVETAADTDTNETNFVEPTADSDFYDITVDSSSNDVVLVNDEESSDEIEFFDGYDADTTLNYTIDPSGDQTDLELLDPNYYSAYIDDYINSLESSDVSESGRQYVKVA